MNSSSHGGLKELEYFETYGVENLLNDSGYRLYYETSDGLETFMHFVFYDRNEFNLIYKERMSPWGNINPTVDYTYDDLNRLSCKDFRFGNFRETSSYTYKDNNGKASVEIDKYSTCINNSEELEYSYTYDGEGNNNFANPDSDPIEHFFKDVYPWIKWGNSPDDTTTIFERIGGLLGW